VVTIDSRILLPISGINRHVFSNRMNMETLAKILISIAIDFLDSLSLIMTPVTVRAQLSCLPFFSTTYSGNNSA